MDKEVADKVTTPMLLSAGDDEKASLLMELEMYIGLRALGHVTFLRYPRQGHGFTGAALKDYWHRVNVFFDKYLKPDAPAGPSGRRSQPNRSFADYYRPLGNNQTQLRQVVGGNRSIGYCVV